MLDMNDIKPLLKVIDYILPFSLTDNEVVFTFMPIENIPTRPTVQDIITGTSTEGVPTL